MFSKCITVLLFVTFILSPVCISAEINADKTTRPDLSGNWNGTWISDGSGHKGPMKAAFRPLGDDAYDVTFTGRFLKVFPFRYKATLRITGMEGNKLVLTGSQRLIGFGTFEYRALVDESSFLADYNSKKDNGRFELYRTK